MVVSIGIHETRQFRGLRTDTFFGRRRRFALDLIREIEQQGRADLKDAFFESVTDGSGVFKRTYAGRFPAFDRELLALMERSQFSRPLNILDTAISDGSTSVEFFEEVESQVTSEFRFMATDRDSNFVVLKSKSAPEKRVIMSPLGEIVQVVWPPFVFSAAKKDKFILFPINVLVWPLARSYARSLIDDSKNGSREIDIEEIDFRCKSFRDLEKRDSRMQFERWDITTPWTGDKMHCVRAMNILNPSYFSDQQLTCIIKNLMDCLIDGGLLAIGSNEGPEFDVDGAIYRKEGRELVKLLSSGKGPRCHKALQSVLLERSL